MPTYNLYAGETVHGQRRFRPRGRLVCYHQSSGVSARLFVGLNVGSTKAYSMSDVVDIVWKVRKRQGRDASASILAQKGIYESFKGKKVVERRRPSPMR